MPNYESDPYGVFAFKVSIDGEEVGYFQEVTGLSATIKVDSVPEGGRNFSQRRLVGGGDFPPITLKRGLATATLLDRVMNFHKNRTRISNLTITLLASDAQTTVSQWVFKNCIPSKWDGPSLNVSQSGMAIETLELTHEGMESYMAPVTLNRTGKAG